MGIPWILISIGLLIIIIGIGFIIIKKSSKKQRPTDYYTFFIMGITWFPLGLIFMVTMEERDMGIFFLILGLAYLAIGLSHKKDWGKNHEANKWKNLTKQEQKIKIWIIVILGLLVLAGLVAFLAFSFL